MSEAVGPDQTVVDSDFSLMLSDREATFVVAPRSAYLGRAKEAIERNFVEVTESPTRKKRKLLLLCKERGFSRLAKSIQASREPCLKVFFLAKTHKDKVPYRVIVSKNSWQWELAKFLHRSLSRNWQLTAPS